jgi:hypothetical protein
MKNKKEKWDKIEKFLIKKTKNMNTREILEFLVNIGTRYIIYDYVHELIKKEREKLKDEKVL